MDKINWGIIGCGDVTELKSGPAFKKVPHSSLVAVMRRDASKAKDYASRHQVPKWYDDAMKLIHDPEVNAVYIATPPSSHKEYAIAAIDARKPVYIEKPMALQYADASEIARYAAERNVKVSVAHYRRGQPKFNKIKQLLAEKAIGDIRCCRLLFLRPVLSAEALQSERTKWRLDPLISGGGLFHDLAPHQLDLAVYFFGEPIAAHGFSGNQAGAYMADDFVSGNILFNGNIVFNGLWSFAAMPGGDADVFEIIGSAGKISFAVFDHLSFTLTTAAGNEVFPFGPLMHVQQPLIELVVNYFLGKGENPSSAANGVTVMKLMDELTRKPL